MPKLTTNISPGKRESAKSSTSTLTSPSPQAQTSALPFIYPSFKPYTGFTTLLHRFSRPDTNDLQMNELQRQNEEIDRVSSERAVKRLDSQRAELTPRQEMKLELARIGASVDKLLKGRLDAQDSYHPKDAMFIKINNQMNKMQVPELLDNQRFVMSEAKEKALFIAELMAMLHKPHASRIQNQDASLEDVYTRVQQRLQEEKEKELERIQKSSKTQSMREVDALFESLEKLDRRRMTDQRCVIKTK